jgi:hypothetical protein
MAAHSLESQDENTGLVYTGTSAAENDIGGRQEAVVFSGRL